MIEGGTGMCDVNNVNKKGRVFPIAKKCIKIKAEKDIRILY